MDYKDKYSKYKDKYLMALKGGGGVSSNTERVEPSTFEILHELFMETRLSIDTQHIKILWGAPPGIGNFSTFINKDLNGRKIVTSVPGDCLMFFGGGSANRAVWDALSSPLTKNGSTFKTKKDISRQGGAHDPMGLLIDTKTKILVDIAPKPITLSIMKAVGRTVLGEINEYADEYDNFHTTYCYKPKINDYDYIYPYSTPVYLDLHNKMNTEYANNTGILYVAYPRGNANRGADESTKPVFSDEICKTASEFLKKVTYTTASIIHLLLYINLKKHERSETPIQEYSFSNGASGIFKFPGLDPKEIAVAHIIGMLLGEKMFVDKKYNIPRTYTRLSIICQAQGDSSQFSDGITEFINKITKLTNPTMHLTRYLEKIPGFTVESG